MKNLILSAIFAVVAFSSNAQYDATINEYQKYYLNRYNIAYASTYLRAYVESGKATDSISDIEVKSIYSKFSKVNTNFVSIKESPTHIIGFGNEYISLRTTDEPILTALFNETIKITGLKSVYVNDHENDIQLIEILEYVSDNYPGVGVVIMKKSFDGIYDMISQPEFDNVNVKYINYPQEIGDCPNCVAVQ